MMPKMLAVLLTAALSAAASLALASPQQFVSAAGGHRAAPAAPAAVQQADIENLPSGVRIEHLIRGAGARPTTDGTVTVHYRGTLVVQGPGEGPEFDNSYRRGAPASFALRQVIPCWTEALQHIAVGGKATILCPSNTAYGAGGAGGAVPPNADLQFKVELLDVR
jgi:FKBP-type peptidyl-prolyl cis-trans isomerase FkpA